MVLSGRMLEPEPDDIELLLPWHAAGRLSVRDARRVDEALAGDPELARQYAVVREEYAETIALNESLGAPSVRVMQKLFAAINAEPERRSFAPRNLATRIQGFFAGVSPRTLAWSASLGALALLLQAGVIGAILVKNETTTYRTASLSMNEPVTRAQGGEAPPRALVRFVPEARISDITTLLDTYQASIVGGGKGGMFQLQFGDHAMSKEDVASLMSRLQGEKIVNLAVPAQ